MTRLATACVLGVALAAFLVAGCGGGDDAAAPAESEATQAEEATATTEESDDTATDETATESGESSAATGPAPSPGQGLLVLDDGRSFAIAISACEFQPNGTFNVDGTSDDGATFEMTQFYLGDDWSQSQVSLEYPETRDQIYVIVSKATDGAEPATVEGKSVTWTQTFKELDESANAHVYTGEGTVQLTCT
jgi:hypothetical protein